MKRPSNRPPNLHGLMIVSGTVSFLLMLAVSLLLVPSWLLLAAEASLLTAQLSLIAIVLFLHGERLATRVWIAGLYACGVYFAAFVPPALAADRYGYAALSLAHLGIGILAAYVTVCGAAWRWSTNMRLLHASLTEDPAGNASRPGQYRLIDLMKWMTLCCIALGTWSTVTARFESQQPLVPWRGAYYAYSLPRENDVGGLSFIIGGPVMLLHLGVYWVVLSSGNRRWRWLMGLATLWMLVAIFSLLSRSPAPALMPLVTGPLFLAPAAIHALAMRAMGWRLAARS